MLTSFPRLPTGLHFLQRGWLSSNSVLLRDDACNTLIDTGYWTHNAQTLSLVQGALQGQPLHRILNTHLHSDHCGGNAALQEAFPKVETFIPPGNASHVFDWDPAALSYTPTGQHCPVFKASGLIYPGDEFTVGDMFWRAYAAPGHDPDSLIFFSPSHKILISADALWENGFGVVFPEIEGIHAFQTVAETLSLIEDLAPEVVLPGHGGIFFDVRQALGRARSRLQMFVNDPRKHAVYAEKVLIKFKLLELQRIELNAFTDWAERCELLQMLHQHFEEQPSFQDWLHQLLEELVRSRAASMDAQHITNI